jgi:hypothetical protein
MTNNRLIDYNCINCFLSQGMALFACCRSRDRAALIGSMAIVLIHFPPIPWICFCSALAPSSVAWRVMIDACRSWWKGRQQTSTTPTLLLLSYYSYQVPISNHCIHTSFLRPSLTSSSLRAAIGDDFGDRAPPRPSTMPLNDRAKVRTPSSNLAEQMGLRSREKGFIVYCTYKSWS